jgi:hypothetical protein
MKKQILITAHVLTLLVSSILITVWPATAQIQVLKPQPQVGLRQQMSDLVNSLECMQKNRWSCQNFTGQLQTAMQDKGLHGILLELGYNQKTFNSDGKEETVPNSFSPIISVIVVKIDGQDIIYDRDSEGVSMDEWYRDIGSERLSKFARRMSPF